MKLRLARKIIFNCGNYNQYQLNKAVDRFCKNGRLSGMWLLHRPVEFIGAEVVSMEADNATNV